MFDLGLCSPHPVPVGSGTFDVVFDLGEATAVGVLGLCVEHLAGVAERRARKAGLSRSVRVVSRAGLGGDEVQYVKLAAGLAQEPCEVAHALQVSHAHGVSTECERPVVAMFMSAVTGMAWETCRSLLDERVPGAVSQAIKDADTFFGVELPAMAGWTFTREQAATINRPVLSVHGTETKPLWVEVADFLRAALPYVEDCTIEGASHLLQIQRPEPIARAVADFLKRNAIGGAA